MKNFIQRGDVLEVVGPSGGVSSGEAFMVGEISCVACADIAAGEKGSARVEGVCSLPVHGYAESANAAIAAGDKIYFDTDELNVDDTSGTFYGYALSAVGSGATTTINVLLSN